MITTILSATEPVDVVGNGKLPSSQIASSKSTSGKKGRFRGKAISLQQFHELNKPLTENSVLDALDPEIQARRPDPREFYTRYNGRIVANYRDPQYVLIRDIAQSILFSQKTVSDFSKDGSSDLPLDLLADKMFIEFKQEGVLDIVNNGDGTFTSLDNRRLLIAKKIAGLDRKYGIWVRVHAYNEKLTGSLQRRFQAQTWGEAVQVRVGSTELFGYSQSPKIMDEGKLKVPQTIPLTISDCNLSELNREDVTKLRNAQNSGVVNI